MISFIRLSWAGAEADILRDQQMSKNKQQSEIITDRKKNKNQQMLRIALQVVLIGFLLALVVKDA